MPPHTIENQIGKGIEKALVAKASVKWQRSWNLTEMNDTEDSQEEPSWNHS